MNEDYIWVDVRDEMPDESGGVIICFDDGEGGMGVEVGYYPSSIDEWSDVDGEFYRKPLFWAELPKPPSLPEGYFDEEKDNG
jgi:hypothetical protein